MPRVLTETKHYQAALRLRDYVNTLTPGEILPVTKDLSERLEASHGTVIQALKTLAGEGVITREFGKQRYLVAEMAERFSARICVVRPDSCSLAFDPILRGLYEAGQERNWKFIHQTYRTFESFDFTGAMEEADGCILIPPSQVIDREMLRALKRPSRPVVVLLQHLSDSEVANVCIDDYGVGKLAAQTLYENGHRRVLVLRDQPHESTTEERLRGFFATVRKLGMAQEDGLLADMDLHLFDNTLDLCYERFGAFMARRGAPDFSAVFTLSLSGGAAVLRVLRERGIRVPEEVSVLSYGGESGFAAYLNPPLSCIEIDIEEFGSHAADLLARMLESRDQTMLQYKIRPRLAKRATVIDLNSSTPR